MQVIEPSSRLKVWIERRSNSDWKGLYLDSDIHPMIKRINLHIGGAVISWDPTKLSAGDNLLTQPLPASQSWAMRMYFAYDLSPDAYTENVENIETPIYSEEESEFMNEYGELHYGRRRIGTEQVTQARKVIKPGFATPKLRIEYTEKPLTCDQYDYPILQKVRMADITHPSYLERIMPNDDGVTGIFANTIMFRNGLVGFKYGMTSK